MISLGGQALACLDPGAPERGRLLGNLAQARHMRAARTASSADFMTRSASTGPRCAGSGAAARRGPPCSAGYARALGEHPAGLSRARVLRAFREALAASAGAPLVSFDVADSLADWASRNQLWPQTAQAYRMAADARRDAVRRPARPRLPGHLAGARYGHRCRRGRSVDPLGAAAAGGCRAGRRARARPFRGTRHARRARPAPSRGTTANSPTGTSAPSACSGGPLPPGRTTTRSASCTSVTALTGGVSGP